MSDSTLPPSSSPLSFPKTSRRGRPPKPTELKIAEGNRGRRPLPPLEPKPEPTLSLPPAPDHIDPLAAKIWEGEYGPLVMRMKVMTESDWGVFEILCVQESRRRQLEDDIQESGMWMTYSNAQGDLLERARPQVAELKNVTRQVIDLYREFGMSPSSRPKVQMPGGVTGYGKAGGVGSGEQGGKKYFG